MAKKKGYLQEFTGDEGLSEGVQSQISDLESQLATLTERGKSEDQLENLRIQLRTLRGEPGVKPERVYSHGELEEVGAIE